jgi:hypothetical protein
MTNLLSGLTKLVNDWLSDWHLLPKLRRKCNFPFARREGVDPSQTLPQEKWGSKERPKRGVGWWTTSGHKNGTWLNKSQTSFHIVFSRNIVSITFSPFICYSETFICSSFSLNVRHLNKSKLQLKKYFKDILKWL